MTCLWVIMMMTSLASTSQRAPLWLPFCPSSRRLRRGGPPRCSWKRRGRLSPTAEQEHKRTRGSSASGINHVFFCAKQFPESPLMAVMSHLLTFLEQYSHFQQLQHQADQYRVQLKRHRVQHRRRMKALRASYRRRLRDKSSIIHSLGEAISQQQTPSPLSEGEGEAGEDEIDRWKKGDLCVLKWWKCFTPSANKDSNEMSQLWRSEKGKQQIQQHKREHLMDTWPKIRWGHLTYRLSCSINVFIQLCNR